MTIVRFHRLAIKDFERAYRWYARKNALAAERLREAVQAAVGRIRDYPTLAPANEEHERWVKVKRYPHLLYYVYDYQRQMAWVYAVAHERRRLGYWRSRIRRP
jgi:plasmid stabilization system protein ParE